jgi:ABC-type bacteriocin/lantibiotic exporter with double-glycine peptidase domain
MLPRLCLPLIVLAAAGACVAHPGSAVPADAAELRRQPGWVLLEGVEHVPQETEEDCGAAALSTVLARWGVDAPVATLREECAVAGEAGLRAAALRDAARRRGLSAYLFAGKVDDLEHELRRGRPVIVGLVKSLGTVAASHFEVVVGLAGREQVAALDPARGLVRDALPAFVAEWSATKGVTLVVFPPAQKGPSTAADGP